MGRIFVTNNSSNKKAVLRSHDGDSIDLNAKAQDIPIDSKFAWHMPSFVTKKTGPLISHTKEIEEISNLDEAMERARLRRESNTPKVATAAPQVNTKIVDENTKHLQMNEQSANQQLPVINDNKEENTPGFNVEEVVSSKHLGGGHGTDAHLTTGPINAT